jgi:hypothetical protein
MVGCMAGSLSYPDELRVAPHGTCSPNEARLPEMKAQSKTHPHASRNSGAQGALPGASGQVTVSSALGARAGPQPQKVNSEAT